jgi:Mannosyltransferase (PIG-V)
MTVAADIPHERAWLHTWRDVLLAWGASRVAFFAAGAIGHAFVSDADFVGTYRAPPGALSYWASWDGAWFTHIAQHGYDTAAATAFFPLYPLLIHGVMDLGAGPALAGVLVSSVAAIAVLFFLHQLAAHWFDVRAARTAVAALAFFPPAFFLNADYSESLFLALSAGALWALYVRRELLLAGAFGYLAAATRNVGVLLVLPFAAEWLRRRRELRWETLAAIAAPVVGLGAYCLYLWRVADKPLLFAVAQKATWGRTATDPFVTIAHGWSQADAGLAYLVHPDRVLGTTSANPPFLLADTLDFVILVVVGALLVAGVRLLPRGAWLYALGVAAAPLLLPGPQMALISYPRYALAPVPLFAVLGRLLARSRLRTTAWLGLALALGIYTTLEFVTLRWVA